MIEEDRPAEVSSYDPERRAQTWNITENAFIRAPGHLTIGNTPRLGMEVVFHVDMIDVGLRPTGVSVQSMDRSEEVQATDLRGVNVQRLWRTHIPMHVHYSRDTGEMYYDPDGRPFRPARSPQLRDSELERMRLRGPEPETLKYVGDMYNLAAAMGLAPALYVQERFATADLEPLPRTTATKWIRKARDLGLIQAASTENEGSDSGDDRAL